MALSMVSSMLHDVVAIAEEAGREILAIYERGSGPVTTKADDSPLTEADMVSHHAICKALRNAFAFPIVSEEDVPSYAERRSWPILWLVDPLDGTRDFIDRTDEFCVNIGLVENGEPVLGVVHMPALRQTYFAERGGGAFLRDAQGTRQIKATYKTQDLIATDSRFHPSKDLKEFCDRNGVSQIVRLGAGTKLCQLAEGKVDLCPRFQGSSEWDTAAPHCLVQEAGCKLIDLDTKQEMRYNKESLLNSYYIACHKARDFTELRGVAPFGAS